MFRLATAVYLGVLIVAVCVAVPVPSVVASHASNANTLSAQGSAYRWWGVVGYIKGATGSIANPNQAAVAALLSADTCRVNCPGTPQWAQVGVYRGTGGDIGSGGSCLAGDCIRNTSSTPHVYSENRFVACGTEDYSIYDHGAQPSTNHAYWTFWTGVDLTFCNQAFHEYLLAKTYPNEWPQELRRGAIGGSNSNMIITAALEMHNRGVEQNPGVNCFGASFATGSCTASEDHGLHLNALSYGWPLWHNDADPTDGFYYGFNGQVSTNGCSGTAVPYKYEPIGLAFWWSVKTFDDC